MLRRSRRISGRQHVEYILKKGQEHQSRCFVLKAIPNQFPHNRYGITISKKLEKSAVKRNYKRRQIYDILRQLEKASPSDAAESTFDILFLARRPALSLTYHELKAEIQSLALHSGFFGNFSDSAIS